MGFWGVKLYENDISLDVKDRFDDLQKGKTVQEITDELIDEYAMELNDTNCAPAFWFALADTQWHLGQLLPEVKAAALKWLEKDGDLDVWLTENPKLANARKKELTELRSRLNSPQPPPKSIRRPRLYRCKWTIGDVFAYRFDGEYAKENGYNQKYAYFVKVGEETWYPGHVVPIVYVFKKVDSSLSDVNSLIGKEYVPQFYKQIAYEKQKALKKKYALLLLSTSSRVIPQNKLILLGNISNIKRIAGEDPVPYAVNWKSFEEYMIDNFKEWL